MASVIREVRCAFQKRRDEAWQKGTIKWGEYVDFGIASKPVAGQDGVQTREYFPIDKEGKRITELGESIVCNPTIRDQPCPCSPAALAT